MQVVILAGGLGTRLRPLTYKIPKSMVPISGKPYLYYQIDFLKKQHYDDIVILSGYLGEQIEEFFGNGSDFGVRMRYSQEKEPLGTGGALKNARELLKDKFFVIYGDSFLPLEYEPVQRGFITEGKKGLLVIHDNENFDTGVPGNVEIDNPMMIVLYSKKKKEQKLRYVDAGVIALKKDVIDLIPEAKKTSLEEEIFPLLIDNNELMAYISEDRFYDIGTQERIKHFEDYLQFKR